jgi:predicted kinase
VDESQVSNADLPLLVLVTGPPGSGKTTLAAPLADALGLPLVARDELKEVLYDELGTGDPDWSRRLGRAAFELLHVIAARVLSAGAGVVLEANFFRGASEASLEQLPPHRLVQVYCSASDEVVLERYATRVNRHAGHVDSERLGELELRLTDRAHDPLDLSGVVLTVDTTSPVDVASIADQVRAVA